MKIRHNWPNILFLIKRQLLLPKILKFIHAKIHQAGSSFFIIFNVHRFDFAIYIIYVIIQIISCAYWLSQWLMLESIWISWIQYLNLWNEFGAKRKITAIPKENMIFFSHSVYVFLFVNAFWFRQFVISRFKKMQTIWGDNIILDHFLMVLIACIWQLTIKITLSYVIRGKTPLKLINQLWPSCGVMIVKPHQSLMVTAIDLIFFYKVERTTECYVHIYGFVGGPHMAIQNKYNKSSYSNVKRIFWRTNAWNHRFNLFLVLYENNNLEKNKSIKWQPTLSEKSELYQLILEEEIELYHWGEWITEYHLLGRRDSKLPAKKRSQATGMRIILIKVIHCVNINNHLLLTISDACHSYNVHCMLCNQCHWQSFN